MDGESDFNASSSLCVSVGFAIVLRLLPLLGARSETFSFVSSCRGVLRGKTGPFLPSLAAAISVQAELGELWQRARFLLGRLTQERLQQEDDDGFKQGFAMDMNQPLSPGEIAVAQEAAA